MAAKFFFLIFEQIKNIQIFTNFQFFHDHSAVTVALKNIKFGMQPKRTKQVEKWVRRWSDGQYSRLSSFAIFREPEFSWACCLIH